ncbi:membrane-bound lytic transglycosylase F [Serratia liquefaciens]|uniref:transglycosylase SLT domain-containing protein n=1 Tax=Serratia liquefaciens TaxID=614 RepID=UPI00141CE9D3|nr:transglycosylase SLT domain-containing protein [Serratia liquefaciens]CAB1217489.1 membrane-bound lytic transglycosylase F [Serratia liquefaciens]
MSKHYDPSEASPYDSLIADAAAQHGVSYELLRKQLWTESRFKADAQSPTGPKGIAQFTKATAAAYGLSDADRLNPSKSIQAAARHVSDLTKKFGGDELKAMLAYNQGEGPNGKPQLEAYDQGNFAAIGEEGRNYMRILSDVSKSPKRGQLEAFGAITPKTSAVSFEDATKGIGKERKVGTELPESTGLTIEGKEQQAPNVPHSKAFFEATGKTLDDAAADDAWYSMHGLGDAAKGNIANSTLGVAVRSARQENGFSIMGDTFALTRWNSHQWTPEELERIRTEVKNPNYINTVLGGSSENLTALIENANRNAEYDAKTAKAGMGAQLVGGIAGAAFDPVSYVPVAGQAGKAVSIGSKVKKALSAGAQAGALNVISEGSRIQFAGGEAHYAEAAVGGLVFGAGMSAIAQTVSKGARKAASEVPVSDAPKVPAQYGEEVVDAVTATTTRYEHRMEALRKESSESPAFDPTDIPLRDGETLKAGAAGVNYAEAPGSLADHGDVRLANGSVLSGANPVNPKTLDALTEVAKTERAAAGLSLGKLSGGTLRGFDEVSMTIMRSESEAVRAVGANLIRPTTGLESGAGGKFGATASDIAERLKGTDHQFYNDMMDLREAALKDVRHDLAAQGYSKAEQSQFVSRRVAEAVEDISGAKASKLTSKEQELVSLIRDHHDYKAEALKNPSLFGNSVDGSKAMLSGSHFEGGYYPVRYDAAARSLHLERLGGDVQQLKEAIKSSMLGSYNSNAAIKVRVDAALRASGETVEAYAERKAFGIANANGDAAGAYRASGALDDLAMDTTSLSRNDYLEERHLFGNDFEVTLGDGGKFSINDLRHFDMEDVLPAYNRRINGDISILAGTGKTTKELTEEIEGLVQAHADNSAGRYEAESLFEVVKLLTGRSRRDPEGALATLGRSLNDMSYATKNTYMGVQNYTEIASMVMRGGIDSLGRSVPALGKYMKKTNKLNAKEANEVQSLLFGKELDDSILPKRADHIERLRMAGVSENLSKTVGTVKWATGRMAARLPMSRVMVGTTNHIVRAARIETLGDIAAHVHVGKSSKMTEGLRKSAGISDAQWANIKDFMKEHTVRNSKSGEITFVNKEAMRLDPRSMDLWRLADHVASETILRPDKVSMQSTRQAGAGASMAMQFKNFVLRSVNGRTVRRYYEATKNGRALDQSMTIAIELMLAGGFAAMRAHAVGASMQEADRKRYLDMALRPEVLALGALTRSTTLGAPIGMYGFIAQPLNAPGADLLQSYRTSVNPKAPREKADKVVRGGKTGDDMLTGFIDRSLEQVPALQWSKDVAAAVQNGAMWSAANRTHEQQAAADATYRSLSRVVPNDPVTLWGLKTLFEDNVGIYADQKKARK